MNNPSQGQNFRQRRNNSGNYKKNGGGGRQDFRRGSQNSGGQFNQSGSHHARHPELDIVIDARAAQRAGTMRDKYQMMARDAQTGGDRVYGEYCLQHAEHYNRIINAYNESRPQHLRPAESNENGENTQAANEAQPEETAQPTQVAAQPAGAEEAPQAAAN